MNLFKKIVVISSLALLGGCAGNYYAAVNKLTNVSPNINYAPAIDVPYSDVASSQATNQGLNVRWGGQVIESSNINDTTIRLIVSKRPLDSNGRPIELEIDNQKKNYFAVDLNNEFVKKVNFNDHLITFFGEVANKQLVLVNGQNLNVPSLKLIEVVDWNYVDREVLANRQREVNYFYHRTGHHSLYRGHSFRSSYGHSYGSFGHGGFSSRYCRY